jgi:hypothetical protein
MINRNVIVRAGTAFGSLMKDHPQSPRVCCAPGRLSMRTFAQSVLKLNIDWGLRT